MSYYSGYSGSSSNSPSWGSIILAFIGLCIFVFMFNSCSISSDRDEQHMIEIYESDNLVYNQDTLIVYREEIINGRSIGSATYSVYYNSNGNKCKYINGKIIEIENSGGE